MTAQEVFDLLNNVGVDFDGSFGEQCVDWAQVINRLYKAAVLTGANASDIWNTYPQAFYDRIDNKPDNHPQQGDIVIWGGIPGHIAIATNDADINRFKSFDQNFPTGSRVHLQEHNYDNPKVLGWLRLKNPPQDLQTQLDQLRIDRDKNWNLYQTTLTNVSDLETKIKNIQSTIDNLNAIIKDKDSKNTTLQQQVTDLTTQLQSKDMTIQTLQDQASKIPNLQDQLAQSEHNRQIILAAQTAQNIKISNLEQQLANSKPHGLWNKLIFLFT